MISQSIQQDIGLWEVWIEYDEYDPGHFGTLYIIGEVETDHPSNVKFIKMPVDSEQRSLVLMIPEQSHAKQNRIKEVLYSEPIASIDQYHSVSIYLGDTLIANFDEIEIMI